MPKVRVTQKNSRRVYIRDSHGRFAGVQSSKVKVRQPAIHALERKIIDLPYEHGIATDRTGNVLFNRAGGERGFRPTDAERASMRGGIFTHNHPTHGHSLSDVDIYNALDDGLHEIRAVGRDPATGHVLRHRFRPDPTMLKEKSPEGWLDEISTIQDRRFTPLQQAYQAGKITEAGVAQKLYHESMLEFNQSLRERGYHTEYSRTRSRR